MSLPDDESLGSEYSSVCEVLRGGAFLWKVPGLVSGVRLCVSASPVGTRLLETAGRLKDPLDRPKKVELGNTASFDEDCSCLIGDFCFDKLTTFIPAGGT